MVWSGPEPDSHTNVGVVEPVLKRSKIGIVSFAVYWTLGFRIALGVFLDYWSHDGTPVDLV